MHCLLDSCFFYRLVVWTGFFDDILSGLPYRNVASCLFLHISPNSKLSHKAFWLLWKRNFNMLSVFSVSLAMSVTIHNPHTLKNLKQMFFQTCCSKSAVEVYIHASWIKAYTTASSGIFRYWEPMFDLLWRYFLGLKV